MQNAFVGADLIVHNARIITQNLAQPEAAALAVKRGRIYAVGDDAEILALKDQDTKVLDAGGRRLIPGGLCKTLGTTSERVAVRNV